MSTTSQQILFIDPAVGGIASLLAQIDPSIEVFLLRSDQNGLEQIAQALAGRTGVDAVHIISHGGAGYLQLGSDALDQAALSGQGDALAVIGGALAEDADLLLYGCDVAAGEAGQAFISALAVATGADVAASVDPTGPALLGGDGQLESSVGVIDAQVLDLIGIENLLAAPSNASFENNLTGWTTSDTSVGTGGLYPTDGTDWTVNPYGTKMAVLTPAGGSGERDGTYSALQVGSAAQTYMNGLFSSKVPTNFAYVYTDVVLTAGESFNMAWNYVSTDYEPWNDGSWVSFVNTSNTGDLSMSIRPGADADASTGQIAVLGATNKGTGNYSTGSYGSTGWQLVTFTAGQAGTYRVGFAVFNLGDTAYNPYLFVDQAQGTTLKDGTPFGPIAQDPNAPPPANPNAAPVFSATTHTNGSTLSDTAGDDSFATLTGQVHASDGDGDALTFAVSGATSGTTVKAGTYGTFTLTNASTGAFSYTPNDAAIEGLKTTVTESFSVTVADGKGGTASTTMTFTLAGANDSTVFTGTTTGAVTEDGTAVASATVSASDRDTGDATLVASAATSVYGTFIVNAAGQWTYTLGNNSPAVQSLSAGQIVQDTFSIGTSGGGSQTITITLTGANDRPTLSANAALLTQVEDSTDQVATSLATLLGGRFGDVDAGASFEGVLISGNGATAAQGEWQYQLAGSGTWVAVPASGLSAAHALALAADSLIRFVPAANYNGTPGALTVHAADDVYAGGFSSGAGEVFAAVSAEGVSTTGRAVSIAITAVNDAPVLAGSDLAIGLSETGVADAVADLQAAAAAADPVVALSGTIAATDAENQALTYGIQGGQSGVDAESGLLVQQGSYGRLTLDPLSGDWTYTPNRTAAIDALEAGEAGIETFTLKVTDSAGASDAKALTVSITGADDAPVMAAALTDATVYGGQWSYQVPVTHFTDAEGEALVYSAALVDANGDPVGDGSLPAGLSFDGATRTFTGGAPLAHNGQQIHLRVTASDGSASVSDVFRLTVANQVPVSSNDSVTLSEGQTRVFSLADFGLYADADGDALSVVRITSLPLAGTLEHDGGSGWAPVTADQDIDAADIAAGHLRFVPGAGESGLSYATLGFQVSDGLDFSAGGYTLTIHVASVGEAPVLSATPYGFANLQEDTPYTVTTAQLLQGFSDADPGQTATLSVDGLAATNAQVVDNGDGTWTITPFANTFGGAVSLSYRVVDTDGLWASRSLSLGVAGANDTPPRQTGDAAMLAAGTEDQAYTVTLAQLRQGFSDVEGALGLWGFSVDRGTITTSDGGQTYTVTPPANYNGPITISYVVDDGQSGTGTTATFTLGAVNDAPVGSASATLPAATEDRSYLISSHDLLQGFSDVENDALSVVGNSLVATKAVGGGSAGTVTDNGDGTWTFTPEGDFSGAVNLAYAVSDGALSTAASNTFTVNEVSDPPVVAPGLGGTAVAAVLANQWSSVFTGDDPVSGVTGTNRVAVQSSSGYLRLPASVEADTGVTIVTTGYDGGAGEGYAWGGTATAIAFEGTQEQINAALALLEISTASNATVNVALTQDSMIYNPTTGHFYEIGGTGATGISWTDARDAAAASSYNGMQGYLATITSAEENAYILSKLPATGWIGASDATTEGTWQWVTGPETGTTFSVGNNNPVIQSGQYANWNPGEPNDSGGEDYAQFYVGGSNAGQWNDLPNSVGSTVRYYVIEYGGLAGDSPTNDVVQEFSIAVKASNTAPTATNLDQALSYTEDGGPVALGDMVVTDADAGDVITATLTLSHPLAGTLSTGTFGSATSTYDTASGVWTVTGGVADVNAALADVSFVPAPDNGQDVTITTLIRDQVGTGPAQGSISIAVTGVNDLPTSTHDSVSTREDTPLRLTLADFGQYADAETSQFDSITVVTLPTAGALELSDGSNWSAVSAGQVIGAADIMAGWLRFAPDSQAHGAPYATLTYTVNDGTADSLDSYTLTVNVSSVNDLPSGSASTVFGSMDEDTSRTVTQAELLAGFGDSDGGVLAVNGLSADHGSVRSNGDGTWTITPYAHFNGTLTLNYTVVDGQGGSVAASNTLLVQAVNDAPALTTAPASLGAATQDVPKTVAASTLLGGYTDADGTSPVIKDDTVTANHGASVSYDSASGVFTVTPAPGYSGPVTLTYTVTDGVEEITVTRVLDFGDANAAPGVNPADAPVDQSAAEGQPFSYTLAATAFTDADGDDLQWSAQWEDANGNLVGDGDLPAWLSFDTQTREFSGTPPSDAAGQYQIRVVASDGSLAAQDRFTLTVAGTNQSPSVNPLGDQTLAQLQAGISLAGVFADADGDALSLTPTLANGDPLPAWLSWDDATQTLSGNAPGGVAYVDLVVTASDGSASADTTLRINLTDAGQTPNTLIGAMVANNAGSVAVLASGGSEPYPLGTVLTASVSDADGYSLADVVYQWQVSSDGVQWSDIDGASAASFTLGQAQSDQQVRVQAFYNDNGTVLETPVSAAVGVALTDQAGAVSVSGSPAAGQTLQATLTDPDGLLGATPVYTWQSADSSSGPWTTVASGTSSAYTLTNNDGGRYIQVVVSYVDDADGLARTVSGPLSSAGTPVMVQLGAVPPVAADQNAAALEAGGVANAVAGTDPVGNLLTGATDANAGDVIAFDSVRTGTALGLGTPALPDPESAGDVLLQGTYGVLRVNTGTGAYAYTVDNGSAAVQALSAGQQVTDSFNYSVKDSTDLTGTGLLTVTVTGADDAPSGSGLPATAGVTEDLSTFVNLGALALGDADAAGTETYCLQIAAGHPDASLSASAGAGVLVGGSGSDTLTLTGTMSALNAFIDSASAIAYTGAANDDTDDTLTVSLQDVTNASAWVPLGSVAVAIAPVNDVPTLDLDADNSSTATGSDYLTRFQPRSGEAVRVVDEDMQIGDVDTAGGLSDTIGLATVSVAAGALDNAVQTLEVLTVTGSNVVTEGSELRYTFGNYDPSDAGSYLVIAGNGTGKLTFLGSGTHEQYEAALKSVVYENLNPFAAAGTRTITVTVTDGADTGGEPLSVTASTTLLQDWTPVVDLSGDSDAISVRHHAVTYTEGGSAVAIAASDASLTDLDSNIQQVQVSLRAGEAGAPLGAEDELSISPTLVSLLQSAHGISTVISADRHTVTFSGDNTSSVFQVALRGVQYRNTADAPATPLTRLVDVSTLDVDGHAGVPATTTVNVVPVNDAPIGEDSTVTVSEDTDHVFSVGDFGFGDATDADANALASVRVSSLPASGTLRLDGVAVLAGQDIALSDIADGLLVYEPVAHASGAGVASFGFQVRDDGGVANGGVDLDATPATMSIDITPVNDAPVLTPDGVDFDTIEEDAIAGNGQTVASLLGTVADVDTATGAHSAINGTETGMALYAAGTGGIGGVWQYRLHDAGDWTSVSLTDGNALLLRATDLLRFVPDTVGGTTAGDLAKPSLSYHAWDQSAGVAGTLVSTGDRGGSTALSLAADTIEVAVVDINDDPTISVPGPQTVAEDGSLVIGGLSFGDVDITGRVDGDAGNDRVTVTLSVGHGTVTLASTEGIDITVGTNGSSAMILQGTLADVNAAVASLGYAPDQDFSGEDALSIQVFDGGNVGTGAASPVAASVAISVTGVNDAPVVAAQAPALDSLTEDDTANNGNLVSELVGGEGGTGVTDADGAAVDGTEGIGQGIAVFGLSHSGPGNGHWQYTLDGTNWVDVGAVSDTQALLLESSDSLRFVPDAENAAVASVSYYLWDGSSGVAGQRVDVTSRGDTTAFSTDADVATVTVSAVGDAPVVDINGDATGTDGEVVFKPRGDGVALFGSDLAVSDVDSGELLTGATLVLDGASAMDNAFGTTYETLYAQSTAEAVVTGGTITLGDTVLTVSGNGTSASPLVIAGAATAAEYRAALQTLHYINTNPNAFAGERRVAVTLSDDGSTGVQPLTSAAAELVVNVNWTPVLDLNGALTGRNHATSYVEKQATTTYVAAPTATIFDQNGLIKRLVITLQDAVDGADEALSLSPSVVATLQSYGIKAEVVQTDGASHQVVLTAWDFANDLVWSGGRDTSAFQIGLRAVAYSNASAAPDENTVRTVLVSSEDVDGTAGVSATTTINVSGVNIPPLLADLAVPVTVSETVESAAFSGAGLTGTLVGTDEDLQVLSYGIAVEGSGDAAYEAVPALDEPVDIDGVTYDVGQTGSYGTLYLNTGTGQYVYVPDAAALDPIADADQKTETFHVSVSDGQAALVVKAFTVTLTGANDAPTLGSVDASLVEEDLAGTTVDTGLTGQLPGADVDEGAVLVYGIDGGVADLDGSGQPTGTVSRALAYGTLTVDTATGAYTYTRDVAATEALAAGQSVSDSFTVTVSDGMAATVSSTLTVSIAGGNDAPVAQLVTAAATEDAGVITGSVGSSDVDLPETAASYALDAAVAGLSLDTDGSYSFDPSHAAYQHLADGETLDVVASYTVTDDQGATGSATLTITVTGTNDAPVVVAATAAAVEDGPVVTGQLTDSTSDVDLAEPGLSFQLDSEVAGLTLAADGSYSFDPSHAAYQHLADGATLDVEAAYTVTDDQGASASGTLVITLTGTNDAPVAQAHAGTAREKSGTDNAVAGQDATGDVLTGGTDIDVGDTRSVVQIEALTGTGAAQSVSADSSSDSGYVQVQGAYGQLRIGADGSYRYLVDELNAEVQALRIPSDTLQDVFRYTMADGSGATAAADLTVTIEGANDAPTLVRVSSLEVTELTGAGAVTASAVNVGVLSTDDPDDAGNFSYDIIGGAEQFYFQIGSDAGVPVLQLKQGVPLNAEFLSQCSVVVRSTDALGASTFETFVLRVNDVNEFGVTVPTFNVQPMAEGLAPNTVPENSEIGSFIGITAAATDADATDHTVTYSLVGSALGAPYTAGEFRIEAADGRIYVDGAIDRETGGGARTLYVKATSSDGSSAIRSINLFIQDVNEHAVSAPADADAGSNHVPENAATGLPVGVTASAFDADATNSTVTYSLVGDGNGAPYSAGEFAVHATSGVVTVAGPIDREAGATRSLFVKATSADGSSAITALTVTVDDVNEYAAVFGSGATGSVVENAATGTVVYQAVTSDADATAGQRSVVYSLGGADAALLAVDAASGAVTLAASADFEAKGSYSFNVLATNGSLVSSQAVQVTVGNVLELPAQPLAVTGQLWSGQTLALDLSGVSQADRSLLSFQWTADGQPIANATGSSLVLGDAQVGKVVGVLVNGQGLGTVVPVAMPGAGLVGAADPDAQTGGSGSPAGSGVVVEAPATDTGSPGSLITVVSGVSQGDGDATAGGVITSITTGGDTSGLPGGADTPLGTLSFTAGAGETADGGSVAVPDTFSLYVDKALGINGFWVVDPDSGRLVNLAAAEHGGRIDDSGDLLRIDIQVADGSTFDSTQPSDGLVQVDGALGHVDQSLAGFLPVVSESAPAPIVFWF